MISERLADDLQNDLADDFVPNWAQGFGARPDPRTDLFLILSAPPWRDFHFLANAPPAHANTAGKHSRTYRGSGFSRVERNNERMITKASSAHPAVPQGRRRRPASAAAR